LERLEKERHDTEKAIQKHKDEIQTEKLSQHEIQLRYDQTHRELVLLGMNTCTSLNAILGFFETPVVPDDLVLQETEWAERLDELHAKIERLGPINLAAIDEYQVQNERKVWLDQQNDDLCEAITTLEDAIRKIDKETRARFEQTFEQVNQGIQKMFPRLFGGGHAYLELNSNDLLNSGVTLMARPPGKRISNIQLMSGGEKALTAIALVFSIFELNPAPFCMLDEVDAPLDDNNIGRFNDLVREMSERVQFIVITHNKVTMEIATHLTGVTMSEPGVSRLVTVNVQEAVDILQPGQK
jgi:chromosome segregation protein